MGPKDKAEKKDKSNAGKPAQKSNAASQDDPNWASGPPRNPPRATPGSSSRVSLPAALTPTGERSRTSALLMSTPRSRAWWTSIAVIGVMLLSGTVGLFGWYWFIGYVSTVAGTGHAGYRDGATWKARLFNPSGLAINKNGNMYVTDSANHCIRKITRRKLVSTYAGSGMSGYHDAHALRAAFHTPTGLALGPKGTLYVADTGNHVIRKITPAGTVSTFAGNGKPGDGNGIGKAAQFEAPRGLALDGKGNLYVADTGNHAIRKITPAGVVTTIAGNGDPGVQAGRGTNAQFNTPTDVLVHTNGKLYIADSKNHRIRTINPNGQVGTLAGSGQIGARDGWGTFATFYRPTGLALGQKGEIYLTDSYNHRIRRVTTQGNVKTIAGNGDAGMRNGPPSWASFTWPQHLALGPHGNLYVAESGNDTIRRVALKLFR